MARVAPALECTHISSSAEPVNAEMSMVYIGSVVYYLKILATTFSNACIQIIARYNYWTNYH